MPLSAGAIAGIVIACVVVVAVIVLVIVFEHYKKVKPTFSTSTVINCSGAADCPQGQVCATGTNTCTQPCAVDQDCAVHSQNSKGMTCISRQCVTLGTLYAIDLSGTVYTWSGNASDTMQKYAVPIPFPVSDIVILPNDGSIDSANAPVAVVVQPINTGSSESSAMGTLYSVFSNGAVSQLPNTLPATSVSLVNTSAGGQQWIITTKDPTSQGSLVYTFTGSVNQFLNSTAAQWTSQTATNQQNQRSTTASTLGNSKLVRTTIGATPPQGIKTISGARTAQGLSTLGNSYFAVGNDNVLYGSNDLIVWTVVVNTNETSATPPCANPQFQMRSIAYDTARDRYLILTPTNDICLTNPAIGQNCNTPQFDCTATISGTTLPLNLQVLRYY